VKGAGNQGGEGEKQPSAALLNTLETLPYQLRAGRYQCFKLSLSRRGFSMRALGLHEKPGPMAGGFLNSRSMEDFHAYL
jgi:hypothetical protein